MNPINRRDFLITGAIAAGHILPGCSPDRPADLATAERIKNPLALATYSIWRFKDGLKMPIERCIEIAAEMGFEGLDLLHIQMDREDDSYPFSFDYSEPDYDTLGQTAGKLSIAVGNRSIIPHSLFGADITVECFARCVQNFGNMAVIKGRGRELLS